ncbi:MAG: chorismate mutase [Oscillospiraceae bacterium]|jgi:monofunctional chorismate mutase|nr:chorismate mutase [Oscillospiraceae bacterium]
MDLQQIRKEIDILDDQIAALFNKRMEVVKKVALYKKRTGTGIADSNREAEIIGRVCAGENAKLLRDVFTAVFKASRDEQSRLIEAGKNKL